MKTEIDERVWSGALAHYFECLGENASEPSRADSHLEHDQWSECGETGQVIVFANGERHLARMPVLGEDDEALFFDSPRLPRRVVRNRAKAKRRRKRGKR